MNAVIDEAAKNVTEFRVPGPGERLRSARLARQIDLSKLAAQLHLSDAMVQAIERDDFVALPGRVFVRGYIRNYARLVGVPVESVLKQFDEQVPDTGEERSLHRIGASMGREVRSSHGAVRLTTWLVVLAVVGLFVVWWQGYLSPQTAAEPVAADPPPEAEIAPEVDLPSGDGALQLPPVTAAVAGPAVTGPALPVKAPAVAEPVSDQGVSAPAVAVPAVAAVAERTADAPVAEAPATAGAGEAPPVDDAPAVVLEFDGPCWVDVRDAKRKFKLFGEMPKGTRKVLGGEAPYDIVLGNAAMVRVSVGGVAYDVAQHARGNVARFRLDPRTD